MGAIQQVMLGYGPAGGGGGAWATAFDEPSIANYAGWEGYTMRQILGLPQLLAGSKLRLTLRSGTAGCTISNAYIQLRAASGDAYDFSTTPVQILFSGSAGITIPGSSLVVADDIILPIAATTPVLVSFAFPASPASHVGGNSPGGGGVIVNYYKSGADAATVNASGYTSSAQTLHLIKKLEVFQP